MPSVSLSTLRATCRVRCDMRVGGIFRDQDFNSAINAGIQELYDLQNRAWGENYFLTSSAMGLIANQSLYTLPSDFYKLVGVDWQQSAGSPPVTMTSYEFNERNRYRGSNASSFSTNGTNMKYCIYGQAGALLGSASLNFMPHPQSSTNQVTVWYVPQPQSLVNETDQYNFQAGWEEFVIAATCIKALAAEESDTTVFDRQKAEMKDRIMDMAPKRDINQTHHIIDVESMNSGDDWDF